MKRTLLAIVLTVGLAAPALANFTEGQRSFAVGNYKIAYEIWLPLAEKGDRRAQFSVGILYERGYGVTMDKDLAAEWYRRSAEQGYQPAAMALRALPREKSSRKAAPATPKAAAQARPKTAAPKQPKATASKPPAELSERGQIAHVIDGLLAQISGQARNGSLQYGSVDVSESTDGFSYRIENVTFRDAKGGKADIGTITGNIRKDGARYYRITLRVPDTVKGIDSDTHQPFGVRIGKQSGEVVYDRELLTVTDVDMSWRDVGFLDGSDQPVGSIGEISIATDLTEKDGRWSGPMIFQVADMDTTAPDKGQLALGSFRMQIDFDRLDLARYAELSKKTDVAADADDLSARVRDMIGGLAFEIALDKLQAGNGSSETVRFDNLRYRMAFEALDQQYSRITLSYKHAGLSGSGASALAPHTPGEVELSLALERIPIEEVFKVGVTSGLELMLFGQVTSAPKLMGDMRQAMVDAKTELKIDKGALASKTASMAIEGGLSADATAVFGMSGAIDVSILGLDALVAAHKDAVDSKNDSLASALRIVPVLAGIAEPGVDGKAAGYHLDIKPDGQLLLNGKSIAPVIAALFAP